MTNMFSDMQSRPVRSGDCIIMHKTRKFRYMAKKTREFLQDYGKDIPPAERFFDPDNLEGACGLSSLLIFRRLRDAGFKPRLVYTCGHVIIYCDNYVIDATATQFGVKAHTVVRSLNHKSIDTNLFWQESYSYDNEEEFLADHDWVQENLDEIFPKAKMELNNETSS